MSNIVKPFKSIEKAVRALLIAELPELAAMDPATAAAHVGGDMSFDPATDDWYIRIDKVDSNTNRFQGDFIVDIEVFDHKYLQAESRSLDIEALLLGYPLDVEVGAQKWVFDKVIQNTGPDELPWEDDRVSRLGATYVITARRR